MDPVLQSLLTRYYTLPPSPQQSTDHLPPLFTVLNVAAGKAPMQISTEGSGIPQKAIDGSTSSFFQADTCSLTKQEKSPWWYVNLLEPYMVQLVRLDFGKASGGELPFKKRLLHLFNTLVCLLLLLLHNHPLMDGVEKVKSSWENFTFSSLSLLTLAQLLLAFTSIPHLFLRQN